MINTRLFKHQSAAINAIRMHTEVPYVFLIGGFGCLTGDAEILTPQGHVRLDRFEGGEIVTPAGVSIASEPIAEPSRIVEIITDAGKIRCNGDHRLLCYDTHDWVCARHLIVLNLASLFRATHIRATHIRDVWSWIQTVEDCLFCYLACFHYDDALLRSLLTSDLDVIPSLKHARQRNSPFLDGYEDDDEIISRCIRLARLLRLPCTRRSTGRKDLLSFVSGCLTSEEYRRQCEDFCRYVWQFLHLTGPEPPALLEWDTTSDLTACSIIGEGGSRIHVKNIKDAGEDVVYRMHVEGAECYYANGILHHNCGKSFTDVQILLFLLHAYMHSEEPICIGIFGVTIKLLTQTVIADFERALDQGGIPYKDNRQAGTITVGNVTFVYLAMQDPDAIYAFNFHCALCDEIDEVEPERVKAIVTAIQERCRKVMPAGVDMPSREPFIFFSTTAQGLGGTYQLIKYLQKQGLPYIKIRARTQDNTTLSHQQLELLRSLYTEDEAKAYLDGEFMNLTTGRVYPEFDRKKHVYMPFPITDDDIIYVGADFNCGYNYNVAIVEREGIMYVVDEFHWDYMGAAPVGLRDKYPNNKILFIPDASGKEIMSGFAEEFDNANIEVCWNNKNPSVSERIMAVNKAFRWGQLYVFSNCEKLAMSLETRDFDDAGKPRKGKGMEAPDHVTDSCFAAGTMIYTLRGEVPIEEVVEGDWVLAHDGTWSLVRGAGCTGYKAVIHKHGLTATPDHKVIDCHNKEVAFVDALEYNYLNKEAFEWLRQLYLTELSIGVILMQSEQATGNTLEQELEIRCLREFAYSTEMSGSFITDLYLRAVRFITKMAIQRITISPTSNVLRILNICKSILTKIRGAGFRRRLTSWQQPGTGRQRAISGILGTLSNMLGSARGVIENLLRGRRKVEAKDTKPGTARAENFAPGIVQDAIITQSEEDVYNLSLIGTHTFFANGLSVHNCEYSVWRIVHTVQGYGKILDAIRAVHYGGVQ